MSNKDRKREEGKRDLLALPELDDQEWQRLESERDSQVHIDGIWDDWRHVQRIGAQFVVRFGKRLNIMRNAVPYGEWQKRVKTALPFGEDQALRYMAIADNPVLSNPACTRDLPGGVDTLAALARLDAKLGEGTLEAKLKSGEINAKTTKKQVIALWKPPSGGGGDGGRGNAGSATLFANTVKHLRTCTKDQRVDYLMRLRTAVGALGVELDVKPSPEPVTIEGETVAKDDDDAKQQ
jgi:hypothetical protein